MTPSLAGPIAVIGANGQVGSALLDLLGNRCVGLNRLEADLTQVGKLLGTLETLKPSAVINAAAYTQVDQAEKEEKLVFQINAEAPRALAKWCAFKRIPFVHFSTDYVFDGTGTQRRSEEDPVGPLNTYGRSKLEGEDKIAIDGVDYLIFRTSWVYDSQGKNFLNTMLKLGKERESLKIVGDQFGAPTYAPDLAQATVRALENARAMARFPSGVYHLCNSGETTWYGFAEAIFKEARERGLELKVRTVEAIPAESYPTPAKRPGNSRLSTRKIADVLGIEMPSWEDALGRCMDLVTEKRK